jgi:integrase
MEDRMAARKMKRIGGAKGTYFTPAEIAALLASEKAYSERNWLLILMTVNHGLRATEAITVTREDIRDGCLWVARLKDSARTCQPLIGAEREPLLALAAATAPDTPLFPITRMQFWRIMRAACNRAGLNPVAAHPHSLKHSTCRAILVKTGNLQAVRTVAGHSSLSSTDQYTRLNDQEAARAAEGALTWNQ